MRRFAFIFLLFSVAACHQAATPDLSPTDTGDAPKRIVSLDLCADQYVLKFAPRDHILAVSPEAELDISYMKAEAKGVPQVRPLAENVLLLKPDLIVRSYGGGPNAERFFAEAGIPVLNIGWASDMEGIKRVVLDMADGIGAHQAGLETVRDMETRLANIKTTETSTSVLYATVSGFTTGPGTLIDDFFRHAGLENYLTQPGWHSLPLEQIAHDPPDLIALAYHENLGKQTDTWSGTRNPVMRELLTEKPIVDLDGSIMSCSGWYVVDAIEALSEWNTK